MFTYPSLYTELHSKNPKFPFPSISQIVDEAISYAKKSETVVFLPPLAHPHRLINNVALVPLGIIDFIARPAPSNPFDIELFLDDVREALEKLKHHGVDEVVVAIFDPLVYGELLIHFIPVVRIPKNIIEVIEQNSKRSVSLLLCREWDLYKVDTSAYIQIGVYGFIEKPAELIEPNKVVEEGFRYHGIPWYRFRAFMKKLLTKARRLVESTLCPPLQNLEARPYWEATEFVKQQLSIGIDSNTIIVELQSTLFIDLAYQGFAYVWIPRSSSIFLSALYRVVRGLGKRFQRAVLITELSSFREYGFRAPRSTMLGSWLWFLKSISRETKLIVLDELSDEDAVRRELLEFIST